RNRGTFGGSIAFADPAAELPACLLALGGEIEIAGPQGSRMVKADEFFKGLFETALTPHDVLTAVRIPRASAETRAGFAEFARRQGVFPGAGFAAPARVQGRRRAAVRLAFLGGGAPPLRPRTAESALSTGDLEGPPAAPRSNLNPADD